MLLPHHPLPTRPLIPQPPPPPRCSSAAATAAAAPPASTPASVFASPATPKPPAPAWELSVVDGMLVAKLAGHPEAWDLPLSPKGVKVGAYFKCGDEVLAELDGFSPGEPSLHRIQLPPPDTPLGELLDAPPPEPTPDTEPPTPSGAVVAWFTSSAKPFAAVGALVKTADGADGAPATELYMRVVAPARIGSAQWLATCKRLDLPLPPLDPTGPPIYGEWAKVASFDAAESAGLEAVGCDEDCVWLKVPAASKAAGYHADGSRVEVRLS